MTNKKVSSIVDLSERLQQKSKEEDKSLRFMSKLLVLVNLPYKNPGKEAKNWTRTNGHLRINVTSGYDGDELIGIPYGIYPRLILSYLVTEAVRKQSSRIYLGESFKDFMKTLNIKIGGKTYTIVHTQMRKLFSASFSWTEEPEDYIYRNNFHLARRYNLWWPPTLIDEKKIFECYVDLNDEFYNEITRSPIPIDYRVVNELKSHPMCLDLYMFLSWRTYNIKKPTYISWENLKHQIGHQYKDIKQFAQKCIKYIKFIRFLYPEMSVEILKGRIYLGAVS